MTVCPQCKQESQESLRLHHTTVWECPSSRCRLRFSAPQLDDTQLRAAYEKHYYPQSDNASVEIWDTRARHTRCGSFTAHPKNPPVEPPKPTDNIKAMCDPRIKSPVCQLCKNQIHSFEDNTVDHIVPYSKGGKTTSGNGQLAHRG